MTDRIALLSGNLHYFEVSYNNYTISCVIRIPIQDLEELFFFLFVLLKMLLLFNSSDAVRVHS